MTLKPTGIRGRRRVARIVVSALLLSGTAGAVVVSSTTSAPTAPAAVGSYLCDQFAEIGITGDDEMVHWAWVFGHAAGCW